MDCVELLEAVRQLRSRRDAARDTTLLSPGARAPGLRSTPRGTALGKDIPPPAAAPEDRWAPAAAGTWPATRDPGPSPRREGRRWRAAPAL
eukprot:scaffold449_cov241-Pinguiococcus_pyrenoidosus.AAC.11